MVLNRPILNTYLIFPRNYVSYLIPMAVFNMGIQTFVVMSSYQSIDKKFKKTGQPRVSVAYGLHHTGYMESMAFKHASVCCISYYSRWLSKAEGFFCLGAQKRVCSWYGQLSTGAQLLYNPTNGIRHWPVLPDQYCSYVSKQPKETKHPFSHRQQSHWLGPFKVEYNQSCSGALVANTSVLCASNVFFTEN